MISLADSRMLSPTEKIAALRQHMAGNQYSPTPWHEVLAWTAGVLLGVFLLTHIVQRWKHRAVCMRWQRELMRISLEQDEINLFQKIAQHAPYRTLRRMGSHRVSFDHACNLYLRTIANQARQVPALADVICLRERLLFGQSSGKLVSLERGAEVHLAVTQTMSPYGLEGTVLRTLPATLQVGLIESGPRCQLPTGSWLRLEMQLEHTTHECWVRVRGRCDGRGTQLLLDRPAAMLRKRQELDLKQAKLQATADFKERFPDRLQEEGTLQQSVQISHQSRAGVILSVDKLRLRAGESIAILDGPCKGEYSSFVELSNGPSKHSHFVWRQPPSLTPSQHRQPVPREKEAIS